MTTSEHLHAPEEPWWLDVSMSALLRAAWRAHGDVVRTALAADGFDDLPRNGAYVLGSLARDPSAQGRLAEALGVTKQTFSQLVDALATRGYVERTADPADRRRVVLQLTERGREAAALIGRCADLTRDHLSSAVGEEAVATARRVLAASLAVPADLALPSD